MNIYCVFDAVDAEKWIIYPKSVIGPCLYFVFLEEQMLLVVLGNNNGSL